MTDWRHQQKDLFETQGTPKVIPINAQPQILERLKVLLNEALGGNNVQVHNVSKEVGNDKDHS